jgi:hypothetical protein
LGTRLDGSYAEEDDIDELQQQNNCNIIYNGKRVCFRYILENIVQIVMTMIKIIIYKINTALFAKWAASFATV